MTEIGAPIALLPGRILGRSISVWWAMAAWALHVGIFAMMWIAFPYQLLGMAYLPFFALERWRLWDRLAGAGAPGPAHTRPAAPTAGRG